MDLTMISSEVDYHHIEKMVNGRVTEFQVQSQVKCWNIDGESGHPTAEDKHFAEPVVHDGHVT